MSDAQDQLYYRRFKEYRPLKLDTNRVAILQTRIAATDGSGQGLMKYGATPETTHKVPIHGWSFANTPAPGKTESATRDLVARMAGDSGFEFVAPVFVGDDGGPVIVTPDILVGFESTVTAQRAEAILADVTAGVILRRNLGNMKRAYHLRTSLKSGLDVLALANRLAERSEVRFAEPDMIFTGHGELIPNDPGFPNLWGIRNTGQSGGTPGMDMNGTQAWDITTGSPSIFVVIIDVGVQPDHPDINQVPGTNFTSDASFDGGPVNACDNHGTAVAGCVSAIINNSLGTVGIAPGCRAVSARAFIALSACDGSWSSQSSWTVDALAWAQSIGARVSNNSNIYGFQSSAIAQEYSSTRGQRMVHFACAGNGAASTLAYPASLPDVNAVAALNETGSLASFSNYGTGLAFAAPGQDIYTTDRTGTNGWGSGDYVTANGTSFASPYAAGVAALVLSLNPSLNATNVEQIMQQSCVDLGAPGYDTTYGWGFVNAYNAALVVASTPAPAAPSGLTATATIGLQINLVWTDNSTNETGFLIERSTDNAMFLSIGSVGAGVTNYTDAGGLALSTTYYYRVRATNWGGNSGYSNTANATTPATPATLIWRGDGATNNWDVGISTNWFSGTGLVTYMDNVIAIFDDTGTNSPSINLVGALLPGSVTVNAAQNYTLAGSGAISGGGGLMKTNSGTLTLLVTNDYTGATIIHGGIVSVSQLANGGQVSGLGASSGNSANLVLDGGALRYAGSTVTINRGATLNAGGGTIEVTDGASTLTAGGVVAGNGGLTKTGSGTLTLSVANIFSGGTAINAGTVALGAMAGAGTGTITLNGGTLALAASGGPAVYVNAVNVAATSTLSTPGSGNNNQALSGTWSGNAALNINTGSGGTFSVQGDMTGFSGTVVLTGSGTFRFYNTSSGSSAAAFDLGTGSASVVNRSGSAAFQLGALSGGANTTLSGRSSGTGGSGSTYLIGGNNGNSVFNGKIVNGGDTTAIIKIGSGSLTFTGANSYSGGTIVSNGTLLVNNTSGSGTGTGAVTVFSSGTLGGVGVIAGPATVNGTLAPGGNSVGTLTISNNLVVNGGAILQYDLGTGSDLTVVSGNLVVGGTLNIAGAGGFGAGTYTLFTYGGALSYNTVNVGTAPPGYAYAINTNIVGQINLVVAPLTPFQLWQINYFSSTDNPAAGAAADPDGDGLNNQAEFLAGTSPTNSMSALRIISLTQENNDMVIVWTTAGGRTNAVQTGADTGDGSITNFIDLSNPIVISGSGETTTNYLDAGGVTNAPARYYRIRLVP